MKILSLLWKILLYIWQLPQNIAGLILLLILKGEIKQQFGGVVFYYLRDFKGGITLGEYIIIGKDSVLNYRHEYGHVIQSRILGPLYLFVIGIPSILWATYHTYCKAKHDYYWFYPEAWANKLAEKK